MNWSHESEKHVLQGNNMGSSRSSPGSPATCYSHLTAETFHRNTCKKRRREAPPVTFLYIRSTERANAEQCVLAALQHPPEPCSFVLSFGNGSEKWFWLNFRKLLWQQKKIKESLKRIPFVRDGALLATENLLLTFLRIHTHTHTHRHIPKWNDPKNGTLPFIIPQRWNYCCAIINRPASVKHPFPVLVNHFRCPGGGFRS